jgi:hypothetical protein
VFQHAVQIGCSYSFEVTLQYCSSLLSPTMASVLVMVQQVFPHTRVVRRGTASCTTTTTWSLGTENATGTGKTHGDSVLQIGGVCVWCIEWVGVRLL